jgi:hypothetical protein
MVESSGGVFAPKEQQNLAQGFNPGFNPGLTTPKTAALKVAADQGAFTNTVGNLLGRSYPSGALTRHIPKKCTTQG